MEAQLLDPGKKSRKWRSSLKKLFHRGGKKNKLPDGDLKYFSDFLGKDVDVHNSTSNTDHESQDQTTLDLSHASGSVSPRISRDELSFDSSVGGGARQQQAITTSSRSTQKQKQRRPKTPVPLFNTRSVPRSSKSSAVPSVLRRNSSTPGRKKNRKKRDLFDAPFANYDYSDTDGESKYAPSVLVVEDEYAQLDISLLNDDSPRSFWRSTSLQHQVHSSTSLRRHDDEEDRMMVRSSSSPFAYQPQRSRSLQLQAGTLRTSSGLRMMDTSASDNNYHRNLADADEQGTEVILFQDDENNHDDVDGDFRRHPKKEDPANDSTSEEGDAIFLSLQTPTQTTAPTPPITIQVPRTQSGEASDMVASRRPSAPPQPAAETSIYSGGSLHDMQEPAFAPTTTTTEESPTLSKDLTWVSHEQEQDERPVKEIVFPSLVGHSLQQQEEERQQNLGAQQHHAGADNLFDRAGVDRALSRSREVVRDEIFASLEVDDEDFIQNKTSPRDDEEEDILFEHHSFSESLPSSFDFPDDKDGEDESSLGLNEFGPQPLPSRKGGSAGKTNSASRSRKTSCTSNSTSSAESSKKLQQQQAQCDGTGVEDSALLAPSSTEPSVQWSNRHRKPHSTAFIKRKIAFTGDDVLSQEADQFAEFLEESGQADISQIDLNGSLEEHSSHERFLSAISATSMDDDGFPIETNDSTSGSDVFVSIIDRSSEKTPSTLRPSSSQSGTTNNSRSYGTSHSSAIYSSKSYDSTSNSQTSHTAESNTLNTAGSFPSYSPSYTPSVHGPARQHQYCGGIVFNESEEDGDDGFSADYLSDDYSSSYSKSFRGKQKSTLEEIQLDVFDAVQVLARSASSGMMKFLQK